MGLTASKDGGSSWGDEMSVPRIEAMLHSIANTMKCR